MTYRHVVICSDNIVNVATDNKMINDIIAILKAHGLTATNFGLGPNTHIKVLQDSATPDTALVVDIFGGSDAGMFYEMGGKWFKSILKSTRKMMIVLHPPAKPLKGLTWLERAHDDNYSPKSFTGLANPLKYLNDAGYGVIESGDITVIANSIIAAADKGDEKVAKQITSGTVTLAQLKDMMKRFNAYSAKNGKAPLVCGIKGAGQDYVTKEYYSVMVKNYGAYKAAYGKEPLTCEITLKVKIFKKPSTTSGWQLVPSYKMDYQDTGYTCGPTSLSMGFTELFPGSGSRESQLASWAGTTTSGTGHDGLKKAFLKQCEALKVKGSYSEVGLYEMTQAALGKLLVDPNAFVIAHGDTAGWREGGWINSYGHYVYPIGVNLTTGQYKIADPTKGVVTYSKSGFEAGLKMISQKSFLVFKITR